MGAMDEYVLAKLGLRCPHCSDDRAVEADGRWWFCGTCARRWAREPIPPAPVATT